MSTAFTPKEAAQQWIAETTDESSSEDGPAVVSMPVRAFSKVVPPRPVVAVAARPFDLITRDSSIGTKNEIFVVGMKTEKELVKVVCPKGSSTDTMRALTEYIVGGPSLPGTYSGTNGLFLGEDGNESRATQLAESFAQVLNRTGRGTEGTGNNPFVDTGYRSDKRVSLKYVRTAEDLHTLERDLGNAIPDAIDNMELAFVTVVVEFCWTKEQFDQYTTCGLLP
jgi:hypothetical protein